MQIKACYKLILWFWWELSSIPKNPNIAGLYNISEKEVGDEVGFLYADKHQRFIQIDYNTLSIKVFHKVTLSLLMDMIKHSHSTQSSNFAISLQYLRIENWNEVHFLPVDKDQNFYIQVGLILFDGSRQTCGKQPK